MDQWMNKRSDPALMLSTNSEEIIIAQSKNRAHEQSHWRATIFMSNAKTPAFPPARSSGSPRGAVCSYPDATSPRRFLNFHLKQEIWKEKESFLSIFKTLKMLKKDPFVLDISGLRGKFKNCPRVPLNSRRYGL